MLEKHKRNVVYKETEGAHTYVDWREFPGESARSSFEIAQGQG
jgi:hypothetical protein